MNELTELDDLEALAGLGIGDTVVEDKNRDVIKPKPQPVVQEEEEDEADLLNEMMAL